MLMYLAENTHWVIRSLVNDNLGNIPTGLKTDPNWQLVSATNRHKMFDLKSTSQTYNEGSISVRVVGVGFIDSVAALNIEGKSIQINVRDANDILLYTIKKSLVSVEGIYDPYTYFFSPIDYITDFVVTDLPIIAGGRYRVVIESPSGIAKCGSLLIGKLINIGETEYGMRIGIQDYSVKTADEFGDFTITERSYSKEMTLTTFVRNELVNSLANNFNKLRATPLVWIGSDQFSASFIYGFYKDYGVVVQYPTHSVVQLEIEGLS
jgi:hypothetical protein